MGIWDRIRRGASGLWEGTKSVASDVGSAVGGAASSAYHAASDTAASIYHTGTRVANAASGYIHRGEEAITDGVHWVEDKVNVGTHNLAAKVKDVPVLGSVAQGAADTATFGTQFAGGLVGGATSMVGGAANAALHPIDTVAGLETMAEHVPGIGTPLKAAHGMVDVAMGNATMAGVGKRLAPGQSLSDDSSYWGTVRNAITEPYRKSMAEGRGGEAIGRGVFDIGTLLSGAGAAGAASKAGEVANVARVAEGADVARAAEAANAARTAEGANAARVAEGANAARSAEAGGAARVAHGGDAGRAAELGDSSHLGHDAKAVGEAHPGGTTSHSAREAENAAETRAAAREADLKETGPAGQRQVFDEADAQASGIRVEEDLAKKQGRENRTDWLTVNEFDPKQPAWVRGWLKNERRLASQPGRKLKEPKTPPGLEMGHDRTRPAREGYDYSNSRLQGADLNDLEEAVRRKMGRP